MDVYSLKYQSDFYNYFQKKVSVQIYKANYPGAVIQVRTTEVILEVNYVDEDTPVIGTGVKIGIINEGAFDYLEDLLTSTERQFKCVIYYDSVLVFQGFSICDMNEQQFLPWSKISLQFTDYLRRLESDFLTGGATDSSGSLLLNSLDDISENTSLWTILMEAVTKTGLERIDLMPLQFPLQLYINSTLFETTMLQTTIDSFIFQTYVENNMFYTDPTDYDNTYEVLNKTLRSFGAYLYLYGDKWVLERLDDVTRTGDWVMANNILPTGEAETSLKQEYNKQDGDFQYLDESQVIEYDSGLQKLILNLQDHALETFVFNDYKTTMEYAINYFPFVSPIGGDEFILKTWYIYYQCTPIKSGYAFRGIESYFEWREPVGVDNEFYGLYYAFEVTFNTSEDKPTELSINYKMTGSEDLTNIITAKLRFMLTIYDSDNGTYDSYSLVRTPEGFPVLAPGQFAIESDFDVRNDKNTKVWSVSESFDLTTIQLGATKSIWQLLGSPVKQKFVISFFPIRYTHEFSGNTIDVIEPDNYLGDIQINITQQEVLNKLTYYIQEDFIKTETLDIDFFDLPSTNFGNGLMVGIDDGFGNIEMVKSALWKNYQYTTPVILMDLLARSKFGNYCRTLHKLKGTILFDGHLKPFAVLTDDNLYSDSASNIMKLLVHGYRWDMNKGTYEIEAVEYTDAAEAGDIIIDESGEIPVMPVSYTFNVTQPNAGDHMLVQWSAITNAQTYRLDRNPYSYNPGYYNNSWTTVYTGALLTFEDDIQNELGYGTYPSFWTVSYRLTAINVNGESIASPIITGTFYK
jgi:hypothetical protein